MCISRHRMHGFTAARLDRKVGGAYNSNEERLGARVEHVLFPGSCGVCSPWCSPHDLFPRCKCVPRRPVPRGTVFLAHGALFYIINTLFMCAARPRARARAGVALLSRSPLS